jgi:transcriptional regulator with GAF, ATPase, and Fis domain
LRAIPRASSPPVLEGGADAEPGNAVGASVKTLDEVIADHVRGALHRADGRVHGPGGAAELLGVNASTLRARMDKLHIPFGRRRQRPA